MRDIGRGFGRTKTLKTRKFSSNGIKTFEKTENILQKQLTSPEVWGIINKLISVKSAALGCLSPDDRGAFCLFDKKLLLKRGGAVCQHLTS